MACPFERFKQQHPNWFPDQPSIEEIEELALPDEPMTLRERVAYKCKVEKVLGRYELEAEKGQ